MSDALLAGILLEIEAHDLDYPARYQLVLDAMAHANRIGYQTGVRMDATEPDWPVAFIRLPTGQVSWHLAPCPMLWDGHTTAEKYRRIHAYADEVQP